MDEKVITNAEIEQVALSALMEAARLGDVEAAMKLLDFAQYRPSPSKAPEYPSGYLVPADAKPF